MSEGSTGYGPAGSRYSHCIFVHSVKSSAMGTEITVILDDEGWIDRLMVAYPPDDTEWRDKFLKMLDPGPPALRSCSVVAPPGQPIIAFRPLDAHGEAIPELCCMYRIVQGDWLRDVAPERRVTELVGGGGGEEDESAEVNKRLYSTGSSFNCCMCGTVVPESAGYKFSNLSGDQVRALRLMSSVAKEFPFICLGCYRKHLGMGKAALGSAAGMQAWLMILLLICARGYIAAIIGLNWGGVRMSHETTLMMWAFVGSFLAFESIPGYVAMAFRNPLVLMGVFFFPVCFLAFGAMNPDAARGVLGDPVGTLFGPQVRFLSLQVGQISIYGSLAGFAVGSALGTVDPRKKKPAAPKAAAES